MTKPAIGKGVCAMNAEPRVLIIDSDLKNCKAIKYALTEYGIGAYYTLSVMDGMPYISVSSSNCFPDEC